MITITPKAQAYLKENIRKAEKKGMFITVIKGGCSGMQYKFEYKDEASQVETIKTADFQLFIDKKALLFIIGTQLDYLETQTSAKLVFINPNAKHNCGCGKSFGM